MNESMERAKAFLKSYKKMKIQLENLENQIEEIKSVLGFRGVSFDKIKVKETHDTDMADKIIILLKLKEDADLARANVINQLNYIAEAIEQVEPIESAQVLTKRYIDLHKFKEIAEEMNYSERSVHNLHKRGLEEINRILENKKRFAVNFIELQ